MKEQFATAAADPVALDVEGFGRRYGIGRTTVFAEMKAGRLPFTKVGRRTLIDARDAASWWAGLRAPVKAAARARAQVYGGLIRHARTVLGDAAVGRILADAKSAQTRQEGKR